MSLNYMSKGNVPHFARSDVPYVVGKQTGLGLSPKAIVPFQALSMMTKAAIGKLAPDFCVKAVYNGEFIDLDLSDYEKKYIVLLFYPLDFSPACSTEIMAFSDRVEEFKALNVQVLACSTDSTLSHFAWINQPRKHGGLEGVKIPVLADTNHQIARDYGVLKEDEEIAFRGLFIIDGSGNLRQITVNDLPVGHSVDDRQC